MPPKKKKLSPGAALAKLRMKALSPERRSEIARAGGIAGSKKLTKKQRRERARNAVAARWAKAKSQSAD